MMLSMLAVLALLLCMIWARTCLQLMIMGEGEQDSTAKVMKDVDS